MDRPLRILAIRSLFLFLLSLLLVAGFWYHREFYQIGFTNLLILGGFVTFLVIWAARLAMSGELPRGRPTGELAFTLEEGDRILRNIVRLIIRPAEAASLPRVGHVVRAKYDTGPAFGRLLILDAERVLLTDLSDENAHQAGYRTAGELRDAGAARWGWGASDVLILLRVRLIRASP